MRRRGRKLSQCRARKKPWRCLDLAVLDLAAHVLSVPRTTCTKRNSRREETPATDISGGVWRGNPRCGSRSDDRSSVATLGLPVLFFPPPSSHLPVIRERLQVGPICNCRRIFSTFLIYNRRNYYDYRGRVSPDDESLEMTWEREREILFVTADMEEERREDCARY